MMLGFTLDVGGLLIDRSKALVCRQSRGYTLPSLCRPEALQRDEKVWGRFDRNAAMRLAGHDLTDEEDTDIEELDFQDEDGIVVLRDRENGGSIECIVERTVTVEDNEYYLCSPCDEPVVIATTDPVESVLTAVDDPKLLKKLFGPAYEVLAEDGIMLQQSAFVWTIIPEVDEEDENNDDDMDNGYAEDEEETQNESIEWNGEEEVEVISEFFCDGVEYFVAKTISPVFFITKMVDDEMQVPDEDELERVSPAIEEMLETEWEHEDEIEQIR